MSVEDKLRELVRAGGGRVPLERVVQHALGLAGAHGPLARRLVEAALKDLRGLELEGDEVVERVVAASNAARAHSLALATVPTSTALPPMVAFQCVPAVGAPRSLRLSGRDWRSAVASLARELSSSQVFALSASSARRVLRLGSLVAELDPHEEPVIVSLVRVCRALGRPIASAEDAAGLVRAPVPETPEQAAALLETLTLFLADEAGVAVADLGEIADREVAAQFDFGERAFDRAHLLALPESPGVYLFESAEGEVLYVGKSDNLRRRVASYFAPAADERACRIRDQVHGFSIERTGSELSALLREHELIRELQPSLNVQEDVHERSRGNDAGHSSRSSLAIVQPSAEGGVEIVVVDRGTGAAHVSVVPEGDPAEAQAALAALLLDLRRRERTGLTRPEFELALTWLRTRGQSVSVIDAGGDMDETLELLLRLATDSGLGEGRIIPVR